MSYGNFLIESANLFTVFRWNNTPAIIRFTESDNIYNTLLLSLFIFSDEDKTKVVNILHNKIYEAIPKIILSDISLETKNQIEKKGKDIWEKTIDQTYKELENTLDINLSEKLLVKYEFDEETQNIIRLINLLASKKEALINERVFPEYYEEPRLKNEKKIQKINVKDKEMIEELADELLKISCRLVTMIRWNKNHRNIKSSVSSHSFLVFLIAYILALSVNLDKNEIYEIMACAILHDLPEAFTGDVISPTKRKVEGLEEIISEIEKEFVQEWYNSKLILREKTLKFEKYIYYPFKDNYGKFVRTADLLAALIECYLEISTGNQNSYFVNSFKKLKEEINDISPLDVSEILKEIEDSSSIHL
ncbi:MAG: YfbR-like 5'-deoxynucleotidase [Defluviitoga tunisiensis]|jgi:putative hydrolase of HD superfamily|nr:HD domain-containing protein [Defluviitoga tunisiensis]MDY0379231.1 HD domain-containing protein [Defluviitoga tunisiensis]